MNQKLTRGLLAVFLLLAAGAFAQTERDFETEIYEDDRLRLVIVKDYTGSETNVVIPDRIGGIAVAMMGQSSFGFKGLTAVRFPPTTLLISDLAFMGNKLSSITLPENIVQIGTSAFAINNLTRVAIPPSVKTVESLAFFGNPITSVTIGSNVVLGEVTSDGEQLDAFENGFDAFYNRNGKRAGTYTWDGSSWAFAPAGSGATSSSRNSNSGSSGGSLGAAESGNFGASGNSGSQSSQGFSAEFESGFGGYLAAINLNYVSAGVFLELGPKFTFASMGAAILGTASAGIGLPYIFDYHFGGMGEFYFPGRRLGIGFGGGAAGAALKWADLFESSGGSSAKDYSATGMLYYLRASFYWGLQRNRAGIYADYYQNGKFGLGIQARIW
jgi:hypothetical protein